MPGEEECRIVDVDGITARVHGAPNPSPEAQAAIDDVIRAAHRKLAGAGGAFLLTDDERTAIGLTAQLANLLQRIVGDGPSRDQDIAELFTSIHHIQHALMAQAAARAYPTLLRLLGEVIQERP